MRAFVRALFGLEQEGRVGVRVAAVEAGVLPDALLAQRLPRPDHQLSVAQRRRVRAQHRLDGVAECPARPLDAVPGRHVGGGLVGLAAAEEDARVWPEGPDTRP